jgi:predicted membrane channel-forming protein YqfA (hemolysin III family)
MKNENAPVERPTLRKPIGVFIILIMIGILGWAIGTFASDVGRLHVLIQAVIYLIAGVVWIAPLKPLLRWMETSKWRE